MKKLRLSRSAAEAFVLALYLETSSEEIAKMLDDMDSRELCELHDEAMEYMAEDVLSSCASVIKNAFLPNNIRQVLVSIKIMASICEVHA